MAKFKFIISKNNLIAHFFLFIILKNGSFDIILFFNEHQTSSYFP